MLPYPETPVQAQPRPRYHAYHLSLQRAGHMTYLDKHRGMFYPQGRAMGFACLLRELSIDAPVDPAACLQEVAP